MLKNWNAWFYCSLLARAVQNHNFQLLFTRRNAGSCQCNNWYNCIDIMEVPVTSQKMGCRCVISSRKSHLTTIYWTVVIWEPIYCSQALLVYKAPSSSETCGRGPNNTNRWLPVSFGFLQDDNDFLVTIVLWSSLLWKDWVTLSSACFSMNRFGSGQSNIILMYSAGGGKSMVVSDRRQFSCKRNL